MEADFFNFLKDTKKYALLKRQFCLLGDVVRLDILAITNESYEMEIYELKLKYNPKVFAQCESYIRKFKPKRIWAVVNQKCDSIKESRYNDYEGRCGLMTYVDQNITIIRQAIDMTEHKNIGLHLLKRLSPDYLMTLDGEFYNTKQWELFVNRMLAEHSITTKWQRQNWWRVKEQPTYKPKIVEKAKDRTLDFYLGDQK